MVKLARSSGLDIYAGQTICSANVMDFTVVSSHNNVLFVTAQIITGFGEAAVCSVFCLPTLVVDTIAQPEVMVSLC